MSQVNQRARGEEERYRARTPRSRALAEEARELLPGGNTRTTIHYDPYPLYIEGADGCWIRDVDGNQLLDLTGNHTVQVCGNRHPHVMAAVARQLELGTSFPQPAPSQVELARRLRERVPSMERLRFTNTGTEATTNAIRAARAGTRRPLVAKVEGGYHGSQGEMLVSTHPTAQQAGPRSRPSPVAGSAGLTGEVQGSTLVLPFNEVEASATLLREVGNRLSAVIVEPLLGSGGMIPAEPAYLDMLREVTRELGAMLILDEVISFRLAHGGGQAHYGIHPDLTCLGKMIGGGFPLGVFGGRPDLMAHFDPTREGERIHHPGSLNANPVGLAAALATLEVLDRPAIEQLNRLGEQLRQGCRQLLARHAIEAQVTGLGSLLGFHFTALAVRSYREVMTADPRRRHQLFLGLQNEGVLIDPRGVACLSTATGTAEVQLALEALDRVLPRLH